jgi:hypothetical protein
MTAGFGKPMRTAGFLLLVSMFFVALWFFVVHTHKPSSESQGASIPEAALNRAKDTNYMHQLVVMMREQATQSVVLVQTQNQLTQRVLQVRATLPQDADAVALQVALEKDEIWVKLVALEKQHREEAQRLREAAVSTVKNRMLSEAAVQKKQAELFSPKDKKAIAK